MSSVPFVINTLLCTVFTLQTTLPMSSQTTSCRAALAISDVGRGGEAAGAGGVADNGTNVLLGVWLAREHFSRFDPKVPHFSRKDPPAESYRSPGYTVP